MVFRTTAGIATLLIGLLPRRHSAGPAWIVQTRCNPRRGDALAAAEQPRSSRFGTNRCGRTRVNTARGPKQYGRIAA